MSPAPLRRSALRSRSAFHRDRKSPVSFALRILILHIETIGIETECLETLYHVRRQRGADVENLPRTQGQPDTARVQLQPLAASRRALEIFDVEVARIALDRGPQLLLVDALLLCSPRHRLKRLPREPARCTVGLRI